AYAAIIGWHVGRDVDEVAGGKILDPAGERRARGRAAGEFVEPRLDDRQPAGGNVAHKRPVGIVADDPEALPSDRESRNPPQMGEPRKADHRRAHRCASATAASESRRSIRFNRMSFDRSVSCPSAHSFLKWAYSSSQVGSS